MRLTNFWLGVIAIGVLWIAGMICKVLVDIGNVIAELPDIL